MPTNKKVIGILANYNFEEGRFWINSNYVRYFETYGMTTLVDPTDPDINENIDMLVLPGGSDILASRYRMGYRPEIGLPNKAYEMFDFYTLGKYIDARIPLACVCRGYQSVNVFLGGGLTYHDEDHPISSSDGVPVHFLSDKEGNEFMPISSNHHQKIKESQVAPGFKPLLWSYSFDWRKNEKGKVRLHVGDREDVVEACIHEELPIFGVAWHPEKNYCASEGSTCPEAEEFVRNMINTKLLA